MTPLITGTPNCNDWTPPQSVRSASSKELRHLVRLHGWLAGMTTWLHDERLRAVHDVIRRHGATRVLDLGCGDGDMFLRLANDTTITHLTGLDISVSSLARLRQRLARDPVCVPHIDVREGSMTAPLSDPVGFDCAILIETIEHLPPSHLSRLEHALFQKLRPNLIILTTPNSEFNHLLGVPRSRFRHPDHQFEWTRAKFQDWARRVAASAGYTLNVQAIGGYHPDYGGASQMAVFQAVRDSTSGASVAQTRGDETQRDRP